MRSVTKHNQVVTSGVVSRAPMELLYGFTIDFFRNRVKLPAGVNWQHWFSTHTEDFVKLVTVLQPILFLKEVCTESSCPIMNCGLTFQYKARNTEPGGTSVSLSAPAWHKKHYQLIDNELNTDAHFPKESGGDYSSDFKSVVKDIFKYLFRMLMHAYTTHYDCIQQSGLCAAYNTLFIHFMSFAAEFSLISASDLAPAPVQQLLSLVCPGIFSRSNEFELTCATQTIKKGA